MRIDMPQQGLPSEELFAQMEEARAHDVACCETSLPTIFL